MHKTKNINILKISFLALSLGCAVSVSAQAPTASDSLSLREIVGQVLANYPTLRKNAEELKTANANMELAKSVYMPEVSILSSIANIGPVSKITLPGAGSFSLYPATNYSAAINVSQTLYDFGRTTRNVDVEKKNQELVKMSGEQLKQKLSSYIVNVYYSIAFLQEAVKIKEEQLSTLKEHLAFVQKKMATGSSTSYEMLTTQVRMSNIENQKTDLLSALQVQTCQLNTFLGKPGNTPIQVKMDTQPIQTPSDLGTEQLEHAFDKREEMKIAREKIRLAEMHGKVVNAQNNPILNLSAAGGIKNGYIPDLNEGVLNYSVGIGLKIPLFDANRTKINLKKTNAEMESYKQDLDLVKRSIENEVVECSSNIRSARQKLTQANLQLKQSTQAYTLAETSFKSGVITNLDLLDSSTALSETELSVLKARIDYTLSFLKLKLAMGDPLY